MNRVSIIRLPDNGADPLYPEDCADWRDEDGEPDPRLMTGWAPYVDLPIPMPKSILVITDAAGRPLTITTGGRRIRREDVPIVWEAVQQLNADVTAREGPK